MERRVGGRLENFNKNPEAKFQLILSQNHHLSKSIISDIHYKCTHTGSEYTFYFEPFLVKYSRTTRQNQTLTKQDGVIYTCLTRTATLAELAGYSSTDSFIFSLCRFISRRGQVKQWNQSTKFVGAVIELKKSQAS